MTDEKPKKETVLAIRLSADDRERLEERADRVGMGASTYARMILKLSPSDSEETVAA